MRRGARPALRLPVKIDGRQGTTSLTNGIAMNRF